METKAMQREKLPQLLDVLARDHEVIAPTSGLSYEAIASGTEMQVSDETPNKSPKEFFFPAREVLLDYFLGDSVVVEPPPSLDGAPRVLFTRPCDAASLPVLDALFGWDSLDAFYLQRRSNTTIVALACDQPPSECFCPSVGGSPAGTRGVDILLSPLNGTYHVTVVTEKGKELVEQHGDFFQESSDELDKEQAAAEEKWKAKITKTMDPDGALPLLDFDSPAWETTAQECLDCGICTFLCPTCHCFDIRDEGTPKVGSRVRLWDSCAFPEYSQMPAHQPRPHHYRRYRQRIMHKFKYYRENFDEILCVGCGRCIRRCPVGVDITQVLEAVTE
jgi:sulfhydrogenase subunit beta (sulfur reductase)